MLKQALTVVFYGILFCSLMVFDCFLGNGFTGMIQRKFCKIYCFVKRTLRDQPKTPEVHEVNDINALMLLLEIIALGCTMVVLNKYKKYSMDRIEKLVESKNNLNKSSLRQIKQSTDLGMSCLIDKPQLIKPLNLEVPVLHMAIIDTLGTTRSQPERGDAGDIYNITDSAILSVTSVLDKDFKLQESISDDMMDLDEGHTIHFNNNRYLWDVIEEE